MIVLSHRGYWEENQEKNSMDAFRRSFSLGFGTETDLRDHNGSLVISHDVSHAGCMPFDNFVQLYNQFSNLPLALNIKADGLQELLAQAIEKGNLKNYFFFDMSIPDTLHYAKRKLNFFIRQSEYETELPLYAEASGVWMDEFHNHWITPEIISAHIRKGKKVCIVSPELHGRDYQTEWNEYRETDRLLNSPDLMICTDYPEEAQTFFNA